MLKKLLAKFVYWMMGQNWYRWFLLKVVPKLRINLGYTMIEGLSYKLGYSRLRPGDILLSVDYHKALTPLIGGDFAHAAFCVSKDEYGMEIVEMVGDGFKEICFYDFCKEADRVAIIRCERYDPDYVKKMIRNAYAYKTSPYDVHFEFEQETGVKMNTKPLYCAELVYLADEENRIGASLEDMMGIGHPYISPTGLLKASHASLIWDSGDLRKK